MSFVFKPAIYRASTLYELPRPIQVVRLHDAWDAEKFKVPLRDGDFARGQSRQGVDITLEGQIGSQAGTLRLTEQQMFETLEALRAAVDVSGNESYDLFLYHDVATSTYRRFQSCVTARFDFDLSNVRLFSYSLLIHATDPTIYSTAPGSFS